MHCAPNKEQVVLQSLTRLFLVSGVGAAAEGGKEQGQPSVPQPLQACWLWWAARAAMVHQRLLDRPAATLQRLTCSWYIQVHIYLATAPSPAPSSLQGRSVLILSWLAFPSLQGTCVISEQCTVGYQPISRGSSQHKQVLPEPRQPSLGNCYSRLRLTLRSVQAQKQLQEPETQPATEQLENSSLMAAALHLELALVHQYYRQAAAAQVQLDQATTALGVSLSVTGVPLTRL